MNKKITVIGSTNVDFIMKAPRLPRLGETITDCDFQQTFGGKGANQAVAAARAGGNVTFISCVGDDLYTPVFLSQLKKDQIDISKIKKIEGMSSGSALVMFDGSGDNYLTVAPAANYQLTPDLIAEYEESIAASSMIILQMEIPLESNRLIIKLADEHDVPVMFNYAPIREEFIAISDSIYGLIVNEVEAAALLNEKAIDLNNAEKAAQDLLKLGPELVIITLGASGSLVATQENVQKIDAYQVDAVDTTAAGDTFCGALAVALLEDQDLVEAVKFAAAASALTVTQMGAQPSIPYRDKIDRFLMERK